jgi:Icc-related predicted phosphoesterase
MRLFGRGRRKPVLTLFFATDLHGSEKCFGKFLNAASFYDVDALILGGDLSGKIIVPIIDDGHGKFRTRFLDHDFVLESTAEVAEMEKRIRLNGLYPYRCSRAELDEVQADEQRRAEVIRRIVRDDLERWLLKADEKLSSADVPCLAIAGNDDEPFVAELLAESSCIRSCDEAVETLGSFQVLGFGYSNPTPWNSPRELSEPELGVRLDALTAELDAGRPAIFNIHVPPYNSGLDFAPELLPDRRLASGGHMQTVPVGSTAVAQTIESHRPLLALHGHVHESRGAFRLDGSLCLNPGSEYNAGVLRGVIVKLAEDDVISHQFVAA